MTDIRMSVAISRSMMNPGRGVISAITMPSTAIGTVSSPISVNAAGPSQPARGAAMALAGVISAWQLPVHELENVGEDLRHRAVQMRRNLLSDLDRLVEIGRAHV